MPNDAFKVNYFIFTRFSHYSCAHMGERREGWAWASESERRETENNKNKCWMRCCSICMLNRGSINCERSARNVFSPSARKSCSSCYVFIQHKTDEAERRDISGYQSRVQQKKTIASDEFWWNKNKVKREKINCFNNCMQLQSTLAGICIHKFQYFTHGDRVNFIFNWSYIREWENRGTGSGSHWEKSLLLFILFYYIFFSFLLIQLNCTERKRAFYKNPRVVRYTRGAVWKEFFFLFFLSYNYTLKRWENKILSRFSSSLFSLCSLSWSKLWAFSSSALCCLASSMKHSFFPLFHTLYMILLRRNISFIQ